MCERSFAYVRIKTRVQPLCIRVSLSKNLVEFRRRSGEKSQIIFSATCAAEKISFGLQTCAPSVHGGRRVRCSQAANPSVKKGNFFDSNKRGCRMFCTRAGYAVLASAEDQIFMQTSHARQMTVRRLPMATQSPTRCT